MSISNSRIHITLAAALCITSQAAMTADPAAGRDKVQAACQTCHGLDGVATSAMVPNLSGQNKDYLMIQLEAYRSGQRQHAQMNIVAKGLSDEDIENTAEWYSSIQVTITSPE